MTIKPIHREIQRSHTKEYIDRNGNVSHRNKKGLTMMVNPLDFKWWVRAESNCRHLDFQTKNSNSEEVGKIFINNGGFLPETVKTDFTIGIQKFSWQ